MKRIIRIILSFVASCFLLGCAENATIGQVILKNETDGEITWSSTAISTNEEGWPVVSADGNSYAWVMSRLLPGRVMDIMIEEFVKNLEEAEVCVTLIKAEGETFTRTWKGSDRYIDSHTPFNLSHCEKWIGTEVSGRLHLAYLFHITEEDFMPENRME